MQQPQLASVAQACLTSVAEMSGMPLLRHNQYHVARQFRLIMQTVSFLDDTFKVVAVIFQQIMTQCSGAKSEEDRIMAITKAV
jgi:hypothetical protein